MHTLYIRDNYEASFLVKRDYMQIKSLDFKRIKEAEGIAKNVSKSPLNIQNHTSDASL